MGGFFYRIVFDRTEIIAPVEVIDAVSIFLCQFYRMVSGAGVDQNNFKAIGLQMSAAFFDMVFFIFGNDTN